MTTTETTFFVLTRIFEFRRRRWKGSAEFPNFDDAHARMLLLTRHPKIEIQVVASGALTTAELERYRADIAKQC